jgi:spore coat protein U-like protein
VTRRFAVLAVVFLAAGSARAAPSCKNISVTNLVFGSYDVFNAAPTDSAGTISYSCPPPTVPDVTIDLGLAFGNGTRRMTISTAGEWLAYEIYVDAARTQVWSSTVPVTLPNGNNMTAPYYARAFPLQDVSAGTYSDTLVVTFNF